MSTPPIVGLAPARDRMPRELWLSIFEMVWATEDVYMLPSKGQLTRPALYGLRRMNKTFKAIVDGLLSSMSPDAVWHFPSIDALLQKHPPFGAWVGLPQLMPAFKHITIQCEHDEVELFAEVAEHRRDLLRTCSISLTLKRSGELSRMLLREGEEHISKMFRHFGVDSAREHSSKDVWVFELSLRGPYGDHCHALWRKQPLLTAVVIYGT